MLPASRSGTTRTLRPPRHLAGDALDPRGLGADRVVERERPVEKAALDLAALGHLAQGRSLDGARDLGVDGLDGREDGDAGRAEAQAQMQIDGVAADVGLGLEVGEDVDGSIRDEQRLGIGRHVHDEDVADPASRAQTRLACDDLAHELVGVQAALHQELGLASADQLHGLDGGGMAVRRVDDLERRDVEAALLCRRPDLVPRARPGSG